LVYVYSAFYFQNILLKFNRQNSSFLLADKKTKKASMLNLVEKSKRQVDKGFEINS